MDPERIKHIYRGFTIDLETKRKPFSTNIFFQRWLHIHQKTTSRSLEDVTYSVQDPASIDTETIKQYQFGESPHSTESRDFVIVGGGPVGLYMSILLKLFFPEKRILVLEKRHDAHKKRTLDRSNVVVLQKLHEKMDPSLVSAVVPAPFFSRFYDTNQKLFSLVPFLENKYPMSMPINVFEYYLAHYAQTIGVIIQHTEEITMSNIREYMDANTLAVFDATGGRMDRKPFQNAYRLPHKYISYAAKSMVSSNKPIHQCFVKLSETNSIVLSQEGQVYYKAYTGDSTTSSVKQDVYHIQNNQTIRIALKNPSEPFEVMSGNLTAEQAVQKVGETFILAIGDSFMKTNFQYGNGIYFGFSLAFQLALEIFSNMKN